MESIYTNFALIFLVVYLCVIIVGPLVLLFVVSLCDKSKKRRPYSPSTTFNYNARQNNQASSMPPSGYNFAPQNTATSATEQSVSDFCPSCGATNENKSRFCGYCGAILDHTAASHRPQSSYSSIPPLSPINKTSTNHYTRKSNKKVIAILCVALAAFVLLITIIVATTSQRSDPPPPELESNSLIITKHSYKHSSLEFYEKDSYVSYEIFYSYPEINYPELTGADRVVLHASSYSEIKLTSKITEGCVYVVVTVLSTQSNTFKISAICNAYFDPIETLQLGYYDSENYVYLGNEYESIVYIDFYFEQASGTIDCFSSR